MGMRIQFLSAGQIVAVGAHNRYGGKISVFQLNNNTALTTVNVAGTVVHLQHLIINIQHYLRL